MSKTKTDRPMQARVFRDRAGEWRWSLRACNGRRIADSAEGYSSRAHTLRMVRKIAAGMHNINVTVME